MITSRPGQVHNATMIMINVEQFPQTATWYGDKTYEDLFKNAMSYLGFHIVAENGKWVSHVNVGDSSLTEEFTIKFNDKDNGTEILVTNKDDNAQNGTYYFSMVI